MAAIAAIGFSVLWGAVIFSEARLYDLCIRLKRTNELLVCLEQLKEINLCLFYLVDAFDAESISKRKSDERDAELRRAFDELAATVAKHANETDQDLPRPDGR